MHPGCSNHARSGASVFATVPAPKSGVSASLKHASANQLQTPTSTPTASPYMPIGPMVRSHMPVDVHK
eukprot:scaffold383572_cov34-Prasinocladus_malaysianus.AAC.2